MTATDQSNPLPPDQGTNMSLEWLQIGGGQPDAALPAGHREAPLRTVAKSLLAKSAGVDRAVSVIDAAADIHERFTNLPLNRDLKSANTHPLSVRTFAALSLGFVLALQKTFEEAPEALRAHPEMRALSRRTAEAIEKLTRDLQVPIQKHGMVVVPPMELSAIKEITAVEGLPEIHELADLCAYVVVVEGSGMGASIQARRQLKNFGLTGDLNGGAEYLNSFGGTFGQGVRLLMAMRRVNPHFQDEAAAQTARAVTTQIFAALFKPFSKVTVE